MFVSFQRCYLGWKGPYKTMRRLFALANTFEAKNRVRLHQAVDVADTVVVVDTIHVALRCQCISHDVQQ